MTAPWKDFKTARERGNGARDEKGDGAGEVWVPMKNIRLAFHSDTRLLQLYCLSLKHENKLKLARASTSIKSNSALHDNTKRVGL